MPNEDASVLNYAPQPPRPRRTKLVLACAAGAAGIAIAVGAWVYRPVRSQAHVTGGKMRSVSLEYSATPSTAGRAPLDTDLTESNATATENGK